MNTACTGSSRPAKSRSPSKESTWRPNALRRTVMSSPPSVSWSAVPSSIRSASMIIPAQVPNAGIPAAIRCCSGSNRSKMRASLAIVVDSPPGMTSPSQASSSAGRRTARAAKPRAVERREVLAHVALQREHADAVLTGVVPGHGCSPGLHHKSRWGASPAAAPHRDSVG